MYFPCTNAAYLGLPEDLSIITFPAKMTSVGCTPYVQEQTPYIYIIYIIYILYYILYILYIYYIIYILHIYYIFILIFIMLYIV